MPAPTSGDYEALKLVLVGEHVWYADGPGPPQDSGRGVDVFLASPLAKGAERIRLTGAPENVPLLARLHSLAESGDVGPVEVCSPLCCRSAAERDDPSAVLAEMRSWSVPASLGGWHSFSRADAVAYRLAAQIISDGSVTDNARHLLTQHAIWPYLQLVEGLNIDACCRVVAAILDPHWYIDLDNPHRTAKLESYLGLSLRPSLPRPGSLRAAVFSSWSGGHPDPGQPAGPRQFLWRRYFKHHQSGRGELEASKLFVSYLRLAWTNEVALTHRGRLFVPEYFFSAADEVAAFKEAMSCDHH